MRFLSLVVLLALAAPAFAQPNFDVPKAVVPDAEVLKQIAAKTEDLRKAFDALPKKTPDDVKADVEIYLKAAEWIVRHGEWFTKESPKQTLAVLDAGLERAKQAADGKTPWRDVRGKSIIRGYRSFVDGSVQPVAVSLPEGYGTPGKQFRTDIVLHGRDGSLTEVKFIAQREAAKSGKAPDKIVIEPYGRGNNAYRWAGEMDVFEGMIPIERVESPGKDPVMTLDRSRLVLRGFSMGGAGSWHIGLHYPTHFAVVGPGAGFTTTRGYIGKFPEKLPFDQDKLLHIYDAVDYHENAFNVPIVAYSGEKDGQKAAADNIENALKQFKEKVNFTHLIAPGLAHQMPGEWQAKAEAEYAKYAGPGRKPAERVRFVTYTTRFPRCDWVLVRGLDEHYKKAVVDATKKNGTIDATTDNVRVLGFDPDPTVKTVKIDGSEMKLMPDYDVVYVKKDGKWAAEKLKFDAEPKLADAHKETGRQGPIDDAFASGGFVVVGPTGDSWHPDASKHVDASLDRFGKEWDKFLRGKLPTAKAPVDYKHLVLFGDPQSNPLIAKVLPQLPITWTKDKLVVNGVEYDPKTHVPVLIYPNPLQPRQYVVLNSGHTFHAADFQGTNALLYPRLGDWAVLKAAPTDKDPAAAEVVASGLFDEFWKFKK